MFDVGLIQLREWLRSGRVKDGADDYVPSSGDLLAVGYLDGRRVHGDSQVFVRSTEFDADHAVIFESLGFEVWRVVDDDDYLAGIGYGRCHESGVILPVSTYEEDLRVLEALRQLRDAGDWPEPSFIRYDVMMYDVSAHKWRCVGHDHGYADAREICRKCERMGHVAYLCESQAVCHG